MRKACQRIAREGRLAATRRMRRCWRLYGFTPAFAASGSRGPGRELTFEVHCFGGLRASRAVRRVCIWIQCQGRSERRPLGELTRAAWRRLMGSFVRVRQRYQWCLKWHSVSRAAQWQHRHLPHRRRSAQLRRLRGQGRDSSSRQDRKFQLPGAQPLLWKQIQRHRGIVASLKAGRHSAGR